MRPIVMILALLVLGAAACEPRNFYHKTETGPHGVVTIKKVYYTPEELAARDAARRETYGMPGDPQMRAIEELWPKLTEEQRTSVLRTVEQMTEGR